MTWLMLNELTGSGIMNMVGLSQYVILSTREIKNCFRLIESLFTNMMFNVSTKDTNINNHIFKHTTNI